MGGFDGTYEEAEHDDEANGDDGDEDDGMLYEKYNDRSENSANDEGDMQGELGTCEEGG